MTRFQTSQLGTRLALAMALAVGLSTPSSARMASTGDAAFDAVLAEGEARVRGVAFPEQAGAVLVVAAIEEGRGAVVPGGSPLCRALTFTALRGESLVAQLNGLACQSPQGWVLQDYEVR